MLIMKNLNTTFDFTGKSSGLKPKYVIRIPEGQPVKAKKHVTVKRKIKDLIVSSKSGDIPIGITTDEYLELDKKNGKKKVKKDFKPVGDYDVNMKNLPKVDLEQMKETISNMKGIYTAIDMSKRSPGVCIADFDHKTLHIHFIQKTLKEKVSDDYMVIDKGLFLGWKIKFFITAKTKPEHIQKQYTESLFRMRDYNYIIEKVISWIPKDTNMISIEGYSMGSTVGISSQLTEMGGILRWCIKDFNVLEIPPSTIKVVFSGSGAATKQRMIRHWYQTFQMPCLYQGVGLDREKHGQKKDQSPMDDICDAFAILVTTIHLRTVN